jgi:hypothetical protein
MRGHIRKSLKGEVTSISQETDQSGTMSQETLLTRPVFVTRNTVRR